MRDGNQQAAEGDKAKTLIESFTALLRRLGIQVVFDGDEDTTGNVSQDEARGAEAGIEAPLPVEGRRKQTLQRRSSFTNLQDTITSRHSDTRERGHDLPPRPRSQNTALKDKSLRTPLEPNVDRQPQRDQYDINGQVSAPRRGGLKRSQAEVEADPAHPRPSKKTVVQIREDPSLYEFDQSVTSGDASDPNDDVSRIVELPVVNAHVHISNEEHEAKAKTLRFHHLAAQACNVFWHWCRQARLARDSHDQMFRQATAHDHSILRRQAFEQWRSAFTARIHEKETEKFFGNLEKRAGRARDLFLLTKAFTHWAQCTSDEILRTSAARRHILRTRYFNAWRDITVVNELKVRRQGLSKFLGIWRQKGSHVATLQDEASGFRMTHLAANTYREWFWTFCDRRSPTWYATKLRIKFFDKWRQLTRGLTIRATWSADFAHSRVIRKVVLLWRSRLDETRQLDDDAQLFRRRALLMSASESLHREVDYAPLKRRVELRVDSRLARSALLGWATKTRLSWSAAQINELRIMRNAWTAWNDRLRCQTLSRTIDDRIVVQALYRWVIAERLALCERVGKVKLKDRVFAYWRSKTDAVCSNLGRADYRVRTSREQRMKSQVLEMWTAQAQATMADEAKAQQYRRRRLAVAALEQWTSQARRLSEMDEWCKRAQFFVSATSTINRWREALISTKKARRREAYASIRRAQKIKMTRTLLLKWHNAATNVLELQHQAQYIDEQRLLLAQTSILYQWHGHTLQIVDMKHQADASRNRHLLAAQFHILSGRSDATQRLNSTAIEHITESTEITARRSLNKLNLRLFQIKSHREMAESFEDRTRRKHIRLMLKHWSERSKRPSSQAKAIFSQTVQLPKDFLDEDEDGDGDQNEVRDAATTFNVQATTFDDFAASTLRPRALNAVPSPAYLRTPSRRTTGKVAATSRLPLVSGTPQTTQITPFWNRMHAQYPSGLPRSARPDIGRRSGQSRGVEDIQEASPADGEGR